MEALGTRWSPTATSTSLVITGGPDTKLRDYKPEPRTSSVSRFEMAELRARVHNILESAVYALGKPAITPRS